MVLTVSLQSKTGTVLDSATASYSTSEDGAAQATAKDMVERFNATNKIGLLALKLKAGRAEEQRKAKEEQLAEEARQEQARLAAERAAKDKEQASWKAANAPGCKEPVAMNACEGVKQYLVGYPSGEHAAAARQALQEAEPKFEVLAMELDWKQLDLEACKAPKASTDCDGVRTYVGKYAQSPHAEEGRTVLKKSEPKLALLARQEKAREAAEEAAAKRKEAAEAAEAKRQEHKDCETDCKKNVCGAYVLSSKYSLCVGRCIQNSCNN